MIILSIAIIKNKEEYEETWMELLANSMARMVEWSSEKSVFGVKPCIFFFFGECENLVN